MAKSPKAHTHSRRGTANGSTRGKERQARRRAARENDPRVQEAMAEVRAEQERLERRMAREAEQPAMGATPGAQFLERKPEPKPEPRRREREEYRPGEINPTGKALPWEGDGEGRWRPGAARKLLREGYNVRKVIRMTGVGYRWLEDIPIDRDGYCTEAA